MSTPREAFPLQVTIPPWIVVDGDQTVSADRTAGRRQASVSQPDVGLQKQQQCSVQPKYTPWSSAAEETFTALLLCSLGTLLLVLPPITA